MYYITLINKNMETQTIQLEQAVVQRLTDLQNYNQSMINTFGQIYIRRHDITAELEKLNQLEAEANLAYITNQQNTEEVLSKLREQYPTGVINLQSGTITVPIKSE
jgi:short-subunit dehydrogenase involved in D-alanine esterification of teichoic acids